MQVASPLNSRAQPYIAPLITNDTQANCTFGKMGSGIPIDALWNMKTSAGLINLAEQLTGKSKPLVAQLELCTARVRRVSLLGESQQSSLPFNETVSVRPAIQHPQLHTDVCRLN